MLSDIEDDYEEEISDNESELLDEDNIDRLVDDAISDDDEYDTMISDLKHIDIAVRPDEDKVTSNVLSLFEYCEIISIRSKQISESGLSTIDMNNFSKPDDIAREELKQKKCPLMLRRKIATTYDKSTKKQSDICEDWDVNTMSYSQ